MLFMTFDRYDELEIEAENVMVEDDYTFPTLDELAVDIFEETGIRSALIAYMNTNDKEYRKDINNLIKSSIILLDTEEYERFKEASEANKKATKKDFKVTVELIQKLHKQIETLGFDGCNYFPTMEEVKLLLPVTSEEKLAYLMWLAEYSIEKTQKEEKTKDFIIQYIHSLLSIHTLD